MTGFTRYVDELADLLRGWPDEERVAGALDGAVSREHRATVSREIRRRDGAFFTGQPLARRLVRPSLVKDRRVIDPAVGCGDLLLAAARHMPLASSVGQTLERWGARLYGADIEEDFVRATRVRLALLAARRLGSRTYLRENRLAELLPKIQVADGRELRVPKRALVVLNPPYGTMPRPRGVGWAYEGATRVSRAAEFTESVLNQAPRGTLFAAILPDVLRSGTSYNKWRQVIASSLRLDAVEAAGLFDGWADVDVFILRGVLVKSPPSSAVWSHGAAGPTVADRFKVSVGSVVPHRHPQTGRWYPFLTVHDLPVGQQISVEFLAKRRFAGRAIEAPFVAIRRTSRPGQAMRRATATIITGVQPVAVENHVIVCVPKDGTLKSCKELQRVLHTDEADDWLDAAIRCRHLTVSAVQDVPWRGAI